MPNMRSVAVVSMAALLLATPRVSVWRTPARVPLRCIVDGDAHSGTCNLLCCRRLESDDRRGATCRTRADHEWSEHGPAGRQRSTYRAAVHGGRSPGASRQRLENRVRAAEFDAYRSAWHGPRRRLLPGAKGVACDA